MPTPVHQPPMQRCACGTEFFVVHRCPLNKNEPSVTRPVAPGMNAIRPVVDIAKRDLLNHIEDLERLVRDQQNTITNLMLELAELRIIRDRQQELRA